MHTYIIIFYAADGDGKEFTHVNAYNTEDAQDRFIELMERNGYEHGVITSITLAS